LNFGKDNFVSCVFGIWLPTKDLRQAEIIYARQLLRPRLASQVNGAATYGCNFGQSELQVVARLSRLCMHRDTQVSCYSRSGAIRGARDCGNVEETAHVRYGLQQVSIGVVSIINRLAELAPSCFSLDSIGNQSRCDVSCRLSANIAQDSSAKWSTFPWLFSIRVH
jgi:hypothetical protein